MSKLCYRIAQVRQFHLIVEFRPPIYIAPCERAECRAPGAKAQETVYGFEWSWWKKKEDDIGVQNPLADPGREGGGKRRWCFSIDARSFIPLWELLYVCEWMSAQSYHSFLHPTSLCLANSPKPNFHARHVSRARKNRIIEGRDLALLLDF